MRILLTVMLMVFLAGCVTRDLRTDENNGITINKFFADPSSVDSGDIFHAYMELENVGGRTAKSVKLELISTAFDQQQRENAPAIAKIGQPLPEFSFTPVDKAGNTPYFYATLAPPDASLNRPGEFRVVGWTLQAPFIPEGIIKDFRLLGRATYEYSTSAALNIPVYTKNEFRQSQDLKSLEATSTNGPIKVFISGPGQVVVNTDPDIIRLNNNEAAVYTITLKNTGDGIPFTNNINGLVKGTVRFSGGITPVDCINTGTAQLEQQLLQRPSQQAYDSSYYVITLPENDNGVVLRNGNSATFSCTLALARSQWISRPFGTATIAFDLSYLYFIEKETKVSVKGLRT